MTRGGVPRVRDAARVHEHMRSAGAVSCHCNSVTPVSLLSQLSDEERRLEIALHDCGNAVLLVQVLVLPGTHVE